MFTKQWFKDVAERVLATFIMTFVGAIILTGAGAFNLASVRAAAIAGAAAVGSLLKGLLAPIFTGNQSASASKAVASTAPPVASPEVPEPADAVADEPDDILPKATARKRAPRKKT